MDPEVEIKELRLAIKRIRAQMRYMERDAHAGEYEGCLDVISECRAIVENEVAALNKRLK